uniref:Odorant binding protein 10 n=1 Tax=Drosicha corpulenta TaxID=535978 RepID=A0A0U3BFW4_9HEMI|nr:odorant binding protein 10 [Drosicha corpulenta]
MLRYGSLFLVICIFHVNAENVVVNVIERVRRDIPDECRQPPPPDHLTEVCCDIPTITGLEDAIESCHEQIHKHPPQEGAAALINKRNRWSGKFLASAGPPDGAQSPSHKGPSHERRNCFMECIFNTTGYLTPDGNLNEEALSQKNSRGGR